MVLLADEEGRTVGLLTLEDLKLVGEIESDTEPPPTHQAPRLRRERWVEDAALEFSMSRRDGPRVRRVVRTARSRASPGVTDPSGASESPSIQSPSLISVTERVDEEIGRRSDVVGIYPNDRALIRLAGMPLIEQNDEWLVQRRYLSDHFIRLVLSPLGGSELARSNNNTEEVTTLNAG